MNTRQLKQKLKDLETRHKAANKEINSVLLELDTLAKTVCPFKAGDIVENSKGRFLVVAPVARNGFYGPAFALPGYRLYGHRIGTSGKPLRERSYFEVTDDTKLHVPRTEPRPRTKAALKKALSMLSEQTAEEIRKEFGIDTDPAK